VEMIRLAGVDEIPPGTMKTFTIGTATILVVNNAGSFYALDNRCTHMGGDLSKGKLEGSVVTCPRHKSRFDVTTGAVLSGPKIPLFHIKIDPVRTYAVKTEAGELFLERK